MASVDKPVLSGPYPPPNSGGLIEAWGASFFNASLGGYPPPNSGGLIEA